MAISLIGLSTNNHCAGKAQGQFTGLDWTVYPPIIAKQQLSKHVPAPMKNCWRHHFLCGLVHIKGKYVISSYQNFLLFGNGINFVSSSVMSPFISNQTL
jgi:hypothetical protein